MSLLTHPARRRSQAGSAALVVLVLLVLVVVGAVAWYLLKGGAPGAGMTEAAARMAPANTQVFMAFDMERAGLSESQQSQLFGTLLKSKELQAFNEELKQNLGMTLEQDFLTWLTSSGALIMAPAEGKQSLAEGVEQADSDVPPFRFLAVLRVRDEKKAIESLEKVQQKASSENGVTYTTEDVNGATLHLPAKPGEGPAWTVHKGHLYLGFTADDLKLGVAPAAGQTLVDQPGYKEALGKVKRHDGLVLYADLQGILKGSPVAGMQAPDAEKLLSAMRYVIVGSGQSGNEVMTEWLLVVDPAAAGPLGPKVFSPAHNMAFQSAELYPKASDAYFALNLRMVWDILYEVAGAFPEGREARDMPANYLRAQGIDFQKDILDMLSGELSYTARNMGKIQAAQLESLGQGRPQDPQATVAAFQQVPLMLALGLKDKAALDRLLGKNPQVNMMMGQLPATQVEGVTVRSAPAGPGAPEGAFAFAITDKEILIAINDGKKSIETALQGRKAKESVASLPGYNKVLGLLDSDNKAFLIAFQDMSKVYSDAATELKASGRTSPEFAQALEQLSTIYGTSWTAAAVRADGIYGVGTVDLNPKKK